MLCDINRRINKKYRMKENKKHPYKEYRKKQLLKIKPMMKEYGI